MKINITINGKEYDATNGETILSVCKKNGIEIPTFCHDERLKPFTACFMCVVEIEGNSNSLTPACSTLVTDGMVIKTESDKISETRKMNLELLLSNHLGDCYPPCTLECPTNVDITGYITLISRGMYKEAVKLIRQTNPLPLVCGRVCARPCEDVCRRHNVDSEVAIDWLKRFATDYELTHGGPIRVEKAEATGKKVAIIGAGPAGLTCAYFLSLQGISVDIYEKAPEAGGMLRYGIPAYRLPRKLLQGEIDHILSYGAKLHLSKELGVDVLLPDLKKEYDALFIAVGAQMGSSTRAANEDLENIFQGVDFLREFNLGGKFDFEDKRVIVIGGGNTAIDCARSSLRLNAKEVILAYRRTENEMPANSAEIHDAKLEGVVVRELVAPKEFVGEAGKVKKAVMELMELGEPDESGRRKPMQTGNFRDFECEIVIGAVGQKVDSRGLDNIHLESWGTVKVDSKTFQTSDKNVFCGGDAVWGPSIAIQAIADGKNAAKSICELLEGKKITEKSKKTSLGFYIQKSDLLDKTELKEHLANREKSEKVVMPMIPPKKSIKSWDEVELGLTLEQALAETKRCLECGCQDLFECKLKRYADTYGAAVDSFAGEANISQPDLSHPYIDHDASKCILCGSCIRLCSEIQGTSALGFVNRGFKAIVSKDFNKGFDLSRCTSCGGCISVCPVGALTERYPAFNQGPIKTNKQPSICFYCGDLCSLNLEKRDGKVFKITSSTSFKTTLGNLCAKGKFGFEFANSPVFSPSVNGKSLTKDEGLSTLAKTIASCKNVGIFASCELTNQELDLLCDIAKKLSCKPLSLALMGKSEKFNIIKNLPRANSTEAKGKELFYFGSFSELDNSVASKALFRDACRVSLFTEKSEQTTDSNHRLFFDLQKMLSAITSQNSIICLNPDYLSLPQLEAIVKKVKETGIKTIVLSSYANIDGFMKRFGTNQKQVEYDGVINFGENLKTIKKLYPKTKILASFDYHQSEGNHLKFPLLSFYQTGGSFTNSSGVEVNSQLVDKTNLTLLQKLKKKILDKKPSQERLSAPYPKSFPKIEVSQLENAVQQRFRDLKVANLLF